MAKENKLVNKVKRLIKRAGCPRWLHHFGPKKYEFWQHAIALLIKQECKLGYRRVNRLFDMLGYVVPTYSALAKMAKRIPLSLWQRLLKTTNNAKTNIAAIDGSGMSRPLPSPYYYRRIDKPYPVEVPLKLSIAVDTKTKKILALRLRTKRSHDIKDAKYLIKRLPNKPNKIVADKAYDAEWLHQFCKKMGSTACIPTREKGKIKLFSLRRKCKENFNKRTYYRREIAESIFKAIKCKFGASISSTKISAQRAEVYCRAITHNILTKFLRLFQHTRSIKIS
jgi:transposase